MLLDGKISFYINRDKRVKYFIEQEDDIVLDYVYDHITLQAIEKGFENIARFTVESWRTTYNEYELEYYVLSDPNEMIKDKNWIQNFDDNYELHNITEVCICAAMILQYSGIDFESYKEKWLAKEKLEEEKLAFEEQEREKEEEIEIESKDGLYYVKTKGRE